MTYRTPKQLSIRPLSNSGFRKAEPLAEGQRALPEPEIAHVFKSFFQARSAEMAAKYFEARSALCEEYGACVEIMETASGGLRLRTRLEFLTQDRTLDLDLHQSVAGMGFSLKLHSMPITQGTYEERYERRERTEGEGPKVGYYEQRTLRKYVISESERTSKIDIAPKAVEDLLHLAAALRPAGIREDLPSNVVPFEPARASKPPPKSAPCEPLAEGPAKMHGGKAS